jgi:hypothetical protein
MAEGSVTLQLEGGATHHLAVKIADTPAQRSAGFQYICSNLVRAWGVLFVFQSSERHTFHMRNVREDLDIAFIAKNGRILELKKMSREGWSVKAHIYRANQPYRYVLETAADRLSGLGLDEGNWRLILNPVWN